MSNPVATMLGVLFVKFGATKKARLFGLASLRESWGGSVG
jgi:hypothetical protein